MVGIAQCKEVFPVQRKNLEIGERAHRRHSRLVFNDSDLAKEVTAAETSQNNIFAAGMMIHDFRITRQDDIEFIRLGSLPDDNFIR